MYIEKDADGVTIHAKLADEFIQPCPFCNSINVKLHNTHTAAYWMECECGAEISGIPSPHENDINAHKRAAMSALERWNHRE